MRRTSATPGRHVGPTRRSTARRTAIPAALFTLLSCGDGVTDPPTAPRPATVTLVPELPVVVAGDTVRLKASVRDDRARVISGAPVTWTSSDPAVASVDGSGLVTGLREGYANIAAASGPATASVPLAVHSLDRATLLGLYDAAGGGNWTQEENWASETPVGSWYGVGANAEARVVALRLSDNELRGRLPETIGDLALLTALRVDGNALTGPLPVSLSRLQLRELLYGGTMLCTLRDEAFQTWLNAIPSRDGEYVACNEERADLAALYEAMRGPGWVDASNWLTDAPLGSWFGIAVDSTGRVTEIDLNRNNLAGSVPPEVGSFPYLRLLRLDYNRLEGGIPAEIGDLAELVRLDLDGNSFRGRIPPELGNLTQLETLWLDENQLAGAIPPEMGNLVRLQQLEMYNNRLDGSIPAEFETMVELRFLTLDGNRLEGPLPPGLGALEKLGLLDLSGNRLSGPLIPELGRLDSLWVFAIEGNLFSGPLPPEFGGEREGHAHDEHDPNPVRLDRRSRPRGRGDRDRHRAGPRAALANEQPAAGRCFRTRETRCRAG